jgi:hypothetical protein
MTCREAGSFATSVLKNEGIFTLITQSVPREIKHWSVRLMVKYATVTSWQVRQAWAASILNPQCLKTLKINNDSHFVNKVVDFMGLYINLLGKSIVLTADENTRIQALERAQPMLPLRPDQIERPIHA